MLDDNTVLPSVHEVHNKQSSDNVLQQNNPSESVLYVDLRTEDEESFPVTQSASAFSKTIDGNTEGQIVHTPTPFSLEQSSGSFNLILFVYCSNSL